jgi:hypothetical protein
VKPIENIGDNSTSVDPCRAHAKTPALPLALSPTDTKQETHIGYRPWCFLTSPVVPHRHRRLHRRPYPLPIPHRSILWRCSGLQGLQAITRPFTRSHGYSTEYAAHERVNLADEQPAVPVAGVNGIQLDLISRQRWWWWWRWQ